MKWKQLIQLDNYLIGHTVMSKPKKKVLADAIRIETWYPWKHLTKTIWKKQQEAVNEMKDAIFEKVERINRNPKKKKKKKKKFYQIIVLVESSLCLPKVPMLTPSSFHSQTSGNRLRCGFLIPLFSLCAIIVALFLWFLLLLVANPCDARENY